MPDGAARALPMIQPQWGLAFQLPISSDGFFSIAPELLYNRKGYEIQSQSTTNLPAGVAKIEQEQQHRLREGRAPLRIIVLNLVCTDTTIMRTVFPTATIINATRVDSFDKKTEPLLWDAGDWKIDDRAFSALKSALGRLR